jgi:hypothetical protein
MAVASVRKHAPATESPFDGPHKPFIDIIDPEHHKPEAELARSRLVRS